MAGPLVLAVVAVVALVAVAGVYVVGVRAGSPTVRRLARRLHRSLGNPVQMRRAGAPDTFTSVIKHRGRVSGKTYETPVWAAQTEDGFVIPIVYGSRTDWLNNLLASGGAEVIHNGKVESVVQPEVIAMHEVRRYFPTTLQQVHRLVGVDRCLRVRRRKRDERAA